MKKRLLSLLTAITILCVSSVSVFADNLSGFDFGDTSSTASSDLGGFDFGESSSSGNLGGFDFGDSSSSGDLGGFDFGGDAPVVAPEEEKPVINVEATTDDCNSIELNIENRYKEAYELLCSLGILDKDTILDTTKFMTRKAFSTYIAKLMQLSPEDVSILKFTDIDPTDADAPYVAAVYKAGIMVGVSETYFGASQKVTYEQLLKVLVTAAGYRLIADAKGGYSAGYSNLANTLKITKDLNIMSNEMTNGNVIQAIFNTLFVKINEIKSIGDGITYSQSEETYMEYYFDVNRFEGFFNEYFGTNLFGISYCDENEIAVSESKFKLGEVTCPKELLGKFVTVYSKSNENSLIPTAVLILENANKVNEDITISHSELNSISKAGTVSYTQDNKNKKLTVNTDSNVIYNGAYLGKLSKVDSKYLNLNSGNVRLVNSRESGNYNIIIITQYDNFIVQTANKSTYKIQFKNNMKLGNDNFVVLDPENKDIIVNYYREGEVSEYSSIKKETVLSVSKSPNTYGKTIYNIYIGSLIIKNSVIETIGDDFCVIDSQQYDLAYNWGKANTEIIKVGMNTTTLFTYFDEFFAIDMSGGDNSLKYGFLVDYKKFNSSGLEPKVSIKLFTEEKEFKELDFIDKFTVKHTKAIPGTSTSYATVYQDENVYTVNTYNLFVAEISPLMYVVNQSDENKNDRLCGMLVAYKLDKDGRVEEIHVSDDLSKVANYRGYDATYFSLDVSVGATSLRTYGGGVGPKMFTGSKTKGIRVQGDISSTLNEKFYNWGSMSSAYGKINDGYLKYSRLYEVGADRNIGYAVVESDSAGSASLTEDRPFIIKSITQIVDTDGEIVWKVSGMKNGNSYSIKLPYDRTEVKEQSGVAYKMYRRGYTAADLKPGDIIEVGRDSIGFMTTFVLFYSLGDEYNEKWDKVSGSDVVPMEKDSRMAERYTTFGRIEELEGDTMIIRSYPDTDLIHDKTWNKAARFANASCMLLEETNGEVKVSKITKDHFSVGDEVLIRNWYHTTYCAVLIRRK